MSDAKDSDNAPPKVAQQKSRTPKSKDDRGPKPSEFKAGAYKPLIQLTVTSIPDRYNEFLLNDIGMVDLATATARYLTDASDRFRSGANDPNQIHDSTLRLFRALVAKRLAFSIDPDSNTIYSREMSVFRKLPLFAPTFAKRLIESYGFFKYNGASYRPLDVAFVAFNSFAHAVGNNEPELGIPNNLVDQDFIVNRRYAGWMQALLRRYATVYNLWAQTSRARVTLVQGLVVQAPVVTQGFAVLVGLPANAWIDAIPPDVLQALNIAAAVEVIIGGGAVDQAWINAIRAFRVVVVDWTRERQEELANRFLREHQSMVAGLMKHIFDFDEQELKFTTEGSPAQLVNVGRGGAIATYPFEIPVADIEKAVILTNRTGYIIDPMQIESASAQSGNTARDLYVKSSLKGGVIV